MYKKKIFAIFFATIMFFNILSSAQAKANEKVAWVPVVSKGLAAAGAASLIEALAELAVSVGSKWNDSLLSTTTNFVNTIDDFSSFIGQSEDGKIALSSDLVDSFFNHLDKYMLSGEDGKGYVAFHFNNYREFENFAYGGPSVGPDKIKFRSSIFNGPGKFYSGSGSVPGNVSELLSNSSYKIAKGERLEPTYYVSRGSEKLTTYYYIATSWKNKIGIPFPGWFAYTDPGDLGDYNKGDRPTHNGGDYIVNPSYPSFPPPANWGNNKVPDINSGILNPNGTIEEVKPPVVDTSDPPGTKEYADILNITSNIPVEYEKRKVNFRDGAYLFYIKDGIHIMVETWVHSSKITETDSIIEDRLRSFNVTTTLDGKVIPTPITMFEWHRRPSHVKANPDSNGGGLVRYDVRVDFPYPRSKVQDAVIKTDLPGYQGDGKYDVFSDTLGNVDFKSIEDECVHIDEDKTGICDNCDFLMDCGNHVDENKDGWCDKCGIAVEIPPCKDHIDENKDGNCDICDIPIKPPIIPPDPPDEGIPEFPKPPLDGDIFEWIKYLFDVLTWFFKILIWATTRPFIFLFDCIKTLGTYINTFLTELVDIGSKMAHIFSWIPKEIMDILWGGFSLVIVFCSIKMFKNMSSK